MRHQSEAFGTRAVDEWLIYCKRFCNAFSVWICGEEKKYALGGRLRFQRGISIEMDTPDGLLEIDLENDESWRWRIGTMRLSGANYGFCRAKRCYEMGTPEIHLETEQPRRRIDAFKAEERLVSSPVLVFGIDSCEMVLEDYYMLGWSRQKTLPPTRLMRYFTGSIRTVDFSPDPVGRSLKEIALIVIVFRLIVMDNVDYNSA